MEEELRSFLCLGSVAPVPDSVAQGPHARITLYTHYPIRQGIGVLLPLEALEPLPSC